MAGDFWGWGDWKRRKKRLQETEKEGLRLGFDRYVEGDSKGVFIGDLF